VREVTHEKASAHGGSDPGSCAACGTKKDENFSVPYSVI